MVKRVVSLSNVPLGAVLAAAVLLGLPAGAHAARGDFNGDGCADLAIGVPNDLVRVVTNIPRAGGVNVIYGSAAGLTAAGNQLWTQNTPDVLDAPEAYDHFGAALAVGDFNGDGYADLAVGVPGEDVGAEADAGAVNVIYGSAAGLTAVGNQFLTQATPCLASATWGGPGLPLKVEAPEAGDQFGYALAAGDSNNDGYDDLAIGAPGENEGNGYFALIYGSAGGLGEIRGTARAQIYDYFAHPQPRAGSALAMGDVNGDGLDELAVGMPAGNIVYVYSHPWALSLVDISGWGNGDGELGSSLAVGDFNRDGKDDLAMGAPGNDAGGVLFNSGGFRVCYGPIAAGPDCPDTVLPALGKGDRFGSAMAAGDIDNDGYDDLAVGAPRDDISRSRDAGSVFVMFGSPSGILPEAQKWHQNRRSVPDVAEPYDRFGSSVAILDFDRDGYDDLAVGVSGEATAARLPFRRTGMVQVFPGSALGPEGTGSTRWHQNTRDILGASKGSDLFGASLGKTR